MKYRNNSGAGGKNNKFKSKFEFSSAAKTNRNSKNSNMARTARTRRKNPSLFSVLIKNSLFVKILIITVLATGGIVTCSFFLNKKNEILPAQATFFDYDISNKNRQQVDDLIKDDIDPKLSQLKLTLVFGDRQLEIKAKDYDFQVDANNFFDAAKKTNFTKNETIKPKLKCKEEALQKTLENFSQTSKILPAPFSFRRTGEIVTVSAGNDGRVFNVEKNKKKIFEAFSNFENGAKIEADYDIIKSNNKAIDFEKMKKSLECEPKDASIKTNPSNGRTQLEQEQDGVKLSANEKQKIKDPNTGTYKLKAQILKPKISSTTLKEQMKKDPALNNVISSFSTSMEKGKPANAIHNIKTAAKAINGIVLLPGERFSFNAAIKKAGGSYKKAIVFDTNAPGGQREEEGGGICQVSSTLFGAAMRANLSIEERACHSYRVRYVEPGQDAAVSDGSKNLVLTNNRNFAIKILASATSSSVTVSICGRQNPEDKVEVSIKSEITAETPTYVNAKAIQTVKQKGVVIKQKVWNSHYLVRAKDIEMALAAEAKKAKAAQEAEAKKAEEAKAAQEAEAKKAEEAKAAQEAEAKKAEEAKAAQEAEAKKAEEAKLKAQKNKVEHNSTPAPNAANGINSTPAPSAISAEPNSKPTPSGTSTTKNNSNVSVPTQPSKPAKQQIDTAAEPAPVLN